LRPSVPAVNGAGMRTPRHSGKDSARWYSVLFRYRSYRLKDPDVPVVWTNTKFKMLCANMGHGDRIFTNPAQNKFFENGILCLLGKN
jgi:hypothetical protein